MGIDESLITVTNNENPTIQVGITNYKNTSDVSFIQSKGDRGEKGDTGATYDWAGTIEEYNAGISSGTITDNMVCLIIDDCLVSLYEAGEGIDISNNTISVDKTALSLDNIDNTSDINKPISNDVQTALDLKVDKEAGKGLSTNNLTDSLKSNYDTAYINNHNHPNKTALDLLSGTNTGDQDLSGYATNSALTNGLATKPTVSTGTTAPTSIPSKIGNIYVDTTNYKMYISKGTSSSSDWIKQNGSYSLQFGNGSSRDPADATTYYTGMVQALNAMSSTTVLRTYCPRAGTITGAYLYFLFTAGSAETSNLYIRVNNTTDYLISSSVVLNSATAQFIVTNSSINIPVSAGDYISLKWVTPTWVTNPTTVSISATITVDL